MAEQNYYQVGNASLALLAPWFPRLFDILGLLNEDKKDFKDMESRIRAIFILQYLAYSEERYENESDLAFNRILVNCPFSVSIPINLKLTDKEKETSNRIFLEVKANWTEIHNASIKALQGCFIERYGVLLQYKDKWILCVDERINDVLLLSLPWSFLHIRFPWLEKQIFVYWESNELLFLD